MFFFFIFGFQGGDAFNEISSGESRFSRWFRPSADDAKPIQSAPEKIAEPNHNENGDKTMFAPFASDSGNVSEATAAQISFHEFLQRGKFAANMQKVAAPPHPMPPHPMMENNNSQADFQQQPPNIQHQSIMSNHGPLSVEELEARLRQSGPSNTTSSNMPNDAMKNSAQDMIAFKKLVIVGAIFFRIEKA